MKSFWIGLCIAVMALTAFTASPVYADEPMARLTNPDGTVPISGHVILDNKTGLMWVRAPESKGQRWSEAKKYCEELNLGGYDDWRLPTVREFQSLLDLSRYNPALPKNHPFLHIQVNSYWTSQISASNSSLAWISDVKDGHIDDVGKVSEYFIWPVRGEIKELPEPRFTNPDGSTPVSGDVVLDNLTDLVWVRQLPMKYCTWEEAKASGDALELGGFDDWRLPTADDLLSMIDYTRKKPALPKDHPFTGDSGRIFGQHWTSVTSGEKTSEAYRIDINDGLMYSLDKTKKKFAWHVRGGKPAPIFPENTTEHLVPQKTGVKAEIKCSYGCTVKDAFTEEIIEQIRTEGQLDKYKLKLQNITNDDLKILTKLKDEVKSLHIYDAQDITDISPLAEMTALKSLTIQEIVTEIDLGPISKLTQLKELKIVKIKFKNYDFLKPLNNLETLIFEKPPKNITDLSGFAGKSKLKKLDLGGSPTSAKLDLTDISPIKDSTGLEELSLDETHAADLSALEGMKSLRRLSMRSVPAKDLTPVTKLPNLVHLNIPYTKFKDYTVLAKCIKLEDLNLEDTPFQSLEVIDKMPNLEMLTLERTKVKNWEPLKKAKKIEYLDVTATSFNDLSFLANMPNLKYLTLKKDQVTKPELDKLKAAKPKIDIRHY